MSTTALPHLLPPLAPLVEQWLAEDIPSFDYGGAVVGEDEQRAVLYGKGHGVLAGCPFFDAVFQHLNCKVTWHLQEGVEIIPSPKGSPHKIVAEVHGLARNILMGERIALNILCRASGIASKARALANVKAENKWSGVVAGTRKTTPGFRPVEKYSMLDGGKLTVDVTLVGGADTHRMNLSSMVMLKDNHIASCGSITGAVKKARGLCGFSVKIEVECDRIEEAREAIAAGADVVMLDNFEPGPLKAAAAELKRESPHILIEASGGITVDTAGSYMSPDVDVLSTSSIHQGVPHIDFSLKIPKQ